MRESNACALPAFQGLNLHDYMACSGAALCWVCWLATFPAATCKNQRRSYHAHEPRAVFKPSVAYNVIVFIGFD